MAAGWCCHGLAISSTCDCHRVGSAAQCVPPSNCLSTELFAATNLLSGVYDFNLDIPSRHHAVSLPQKATPLSHNTERCMPWYKWRLEFASYMSEASACFASQHQALWTFEPVSPFGIATLHLSVEPTTPHNCLLLPALLCAP
eukprot:GHUV01025360.1.p1 GENE.GHUV01025360.1~~GHUV01025360.1.p1  ORF type:complete len:143 (+),score=22.89 GHUV01025360.1:184-612(+)